MSRKRRHPQNRKDVRSNTTDGKPWWRQPLAWGGGVLTAAIVAVVTAFGTGLGNELFSGSAQANPSSSSESGRLGAVNSSSSGNSSGITIRSVSFSVEHGKLLLIVTGSFHGSIGGDYLYAVARPSRVPNGTASWLVSEPVSPNQNGQWMAEITLTAPRQKMTVFAVTAGGCPADHICAHPPTEIQIALEEAGPEAADSSAPPWAAS
jgi:hypothetical protein